MRNLRSKKQGRTIIVGAKAEPYRAEMAEQFNITPKFDLSGLPQYAENDKAGVVSDILC